jgi:hypothetical protein
VKTGRRKEEKAKERHNKGKQLKNKWFKY